MLEQGQGFPEQNVDGNADDDAGATFPLEPLGHGPESLDCFAMHQHHQPHPPEKTVAGA